MCDFETGDSVQGLPNPCTHKFHESCIKRWFSTGKRKCPLCQFEVPHGQNPSIRRPSAPPGGAAAGAQNAGQTIYDIFASLLFAMDNQGITSDN